MADSQKMGRVTDEITRHGFAKRLYELRINGANDSGTRLSQEEVASHLFEKAGKKGRQLSSKTISSWETGKTEPGIDEIAMLAEIFNTTCDYLISGTGPERIAASRQYGLSSRALATLENLNQRMDLFIDSIGMENFDYIRPIAFISALLESDTIRDLAVDTIAYSFRKVRFEKKEAASKVNDCVGLKERYVQQMVDSDVIEKIFASNPGYSGKIIVDQHDYFVSQKYELVQQWRRLFEKILKRRTLMEQGVRNSSALNTRWLGIDHLEESLEGEANE